MDKSTNSSNASGAAANHGASSGDTSGCGPAASSSTTATSASTADNAAIATPTAVRASSSSTSAVALPMGAPLPAAACAPINLNISTTTGGNFAVTVDPLISVESLKKIIAKKLKVAKDRICLLHREKELQDGTLKENCLMDGSKIILIPNVETGLLAQRPENTVMQALESLNDSQVNDFLSGKTPLNLSMRLGDHMMLIQLQLSTVNPANGSTLNSNGSSSCSTSRTRSSQRNSRSTAGASATPAAHHSHHSHHHHHHHHHHSSTQSTSSARTTAAATAAAALPTTTPVGASTSAAAAAVAQSTTGASSVSPLLAATSRKLSIDSSSAACQRSSSVSRILAGPASAPCAASTAAAAATSMPTPTAAIKSSDLSSFLSKRDYESLQNIVKSIAMAQPSRLASSITSATLPARLQQKMLTPTTVQSMEQTISVADVSATANATATPASTDTVDGGLLEQSPIKSLSNLVSSPIKTTAIKNIPIASGSSSSSSSSSSNCSTTIAQCASNGVPSALSAVAAACQDPIAAKLTSCLCTRLNGGTAHMSAKSCIETACLSRQDAAGAGMENTAQARATMVTSTPNYKSSIAQSASSGGALLHKTANNPIVRSKHRHHHHHHHHYHHYHHYNGGSSGGTNPQSASAARAKLPISPRCTSAASNTSSNDSGFCSEDSVLANSASNSNAVTATAAAAASSTTSLSPSNITPPAATVAPAPATAAATTTAASGSSSVDFDDASLTVSDTRTLAEASRNLTQTLRKLSKEVFTNKIDLSGGDETPRKSGSGAVIESMKNHGKGIYSGTFSGTLNPALQDRYGRPKRDISTVIHILNDLLSATPQYSRGARISFETPASSSSATASGSAVVNAANSSASPHSSRSKLTSKYHQHTCLKCTSKTHSQSHLGHAGSVCAYGECNGHYVSKVAAAKGGGYQCCQDAAAAAGGVAASPHSAVSGAADSATLCANDRSVCSCRYRAIGESGEREREHTCHKCLIDMENFKTKSKLDQIRLVMQQRKQKREARKLKGAPYGARVVGATTPGGVADATAAAMAAAATTGGTANNVAATGSPTTAALGATAPLNTATATAAAPPSEVSPNHIVEEVDTAA